MADNGEKTDNENNDKSNPVETLPKMVNVIKIPEDLSLTLTNKSGYVQYVSSGRFYAITGFGVNPDINKNLIESAISSVKMSLNKISSDVINDITLKIQKDADNNIKVANELNITNNTYVENDFNLNDKNDYTNLSELLQLLLNEYNKNIQNKGIPINEETKVTQEDIGNNEQKGGRNPNKLVDGYNRRKKLLNKTKQKLKGRQRKTKTSKRLHR